MSELLEGLEEVGFDLPRGGLIVGLQLGRQLGPPEWGCGVCARGRFRLCQDRSSGRGSRFISTTSSLTSVATMVPFQQRTVVLRIVGWIIFPPRANWLPFRVGLCACRRRWIVTDFELGETISGTSAAGVASVRLEAKARKRKDGVEMREPWDRPAADGGHCETGSISPSGGLLELDLLLFVHSLAAACGRCSSDPGARGSGCGLGSGSCFWPSIIAWFLWCVAICVQRWDGAGELARQSAIEHLRKLAEVNAFASLRSLAELRRIVREFGARGIAARVLKGLPVAQSRLRGDRFAGGGRRRPVDRSGGHPRGRWRAARFWLSRAAADRSVYAEAVRVSTVRTGKT